MNSQRMERDFGESLAQCSEHQFRLALGKQVF
jgi:hypothetical protein